MKKAKLSAKALRIILSLVIIVVIFLSGVAFYFAQSWLSDLSEEISNTVARSDASGNDIQSLKKLEGELASRQDIIKKTGQLLASSDTYQARAIEDLTRYAGKAGIQISNFSFSQSNAEATARTKKTASDESSQTSVDVSLISPVSYRGLLKFLDAVESNLPKMQVSSLKISRVVGSNNAVKVDKITIRVYTN